MKFRIFMGLIILLSLFLLFRIYKVTGLINEVFAVPQEQMVKPASGQSTLTVVEFLDYRCESCQSIHPAFKAALARDGHVTVIHRPISLYPDMNVNNFTLMALAAAKMGKFEEMHNYILEHYRPYDENFPKEAAAALGLDLKELEYYMKSDEMIGEARKNQEIFFQKWGLISTPTFIIGRHFIYSPRKSFPETGDFLTMFKEAR